eukprot:66230-Chlamydomonas_euryale.AAC.3
MLLNVVQQRTPLPGRVAVQQRQLRHDLRHRRCRPPHLLRVQQRAVEATGRPGCGARLGRDARTRVAGQQLQLPLGRADERDDLAARHHLGRLGIVLHVLQLHKARAPPRGVDRRREWAVAHKVLPVGHGGAGRRRVDGSTHVEHAAAAGTHHDLQAERRRQHLLHDGVAPRAPPHAHPLLGEAVKRRTKHAALAPGRRAAS